MGLKDGYKQTELGVIPGEWVVKAISHVAPLQRGFDLPNREIEPGPFPIVYSNGIAGTHKAAMVKGPGVITGRSGTLGKVHYVDCDFWPHNTSLWVTQFNKNYPKFIYYLYEALGFERFASGSGVPTLNRNDAHSYTVALPTDSGEQRAIAEALSDADALIESMDQLINKKRDLKQAAMQQLLTGETRLPGFSGEWEVKRLGDLSPLQRGFDLPTSQIRPGPYPVVYSNGVSSYHDNFMVKGPGVVTGRSGTIGNVHFVDGDYWPHNTSLWITSFKSNSPKFVFYLLSRLGLDRFSTGSGVPTLNRNDVHDYKVFVPPTTVEQTAIATILSDMDTELTELESRLAKARHIKQGMMQELLTGRIRLV